MVYFSRPDSLSDGISIHRSRQNMGRKLADKMREILGEKGIEEIDVGVLRPTTTVNEFRADFCQLFLSLRYAFQKKKKLNGTR